MRIAAVGFEERVHKVESGVDFYVYPEAILWKDLRQEIEDLKPHYDEVRLLEDEMIVFSELKVEKPSVVFDMYDFDFKGREIWLHWATEIADSLVITLKDKFEADVVFTEKEEGLKGKIETIHIG